MQVLNISRRPCWDHPYVGCLSNRLASASATTIGLALLKHAYRKFDYNNCIIIVHNNTMFMLCYLSTQHWCCDSKQHESASKKNKRPALAFHSTHNATEISVISLWLHYFTQAVVSDRLSYWKEIWSFCAEGNI